VDNCAPGNAPVGRDRVSEAAERPVRCVRDSAHDPAETAGGRECAALHVDGDGARARGERCSLARVVHDSHRGAKDGGGRARERDRLAFPERGSVLGDDSGRGQEIAGSKVRGERAREAERDERLVRRCKHRTEADADCPRPFLARRALLDLERAGENYY